MKTNALMRLLLAIFAAFALFSLPYDAVSAEPGKKSFADAPVETISVGELKDLLASGKKVLVLDTRVRGNYEMSDVKIKGAVSLPLLEIEKNLPSWPLDGEIITYCS
jgi:hypothetical protein